MADTPKAPMLRSRLSRKLSRKTPAPDDAPLPIAHAAIRWLEYECPACGHAHTMAADLLHEDDGGWIHPEAADRYPVCDQCETQFECESVRLIARPAAVGGEPGNG